MTHQEGPGMEVEAAQKERDVIERLADELAANPNVLVSRDAVVEVLRSRAAILREATGEETAWLIERGQTEGLTQPLWYATTALPTKWTNDPWHALRFASRQDAEAFIASQMRDHPIEAYRHAHVVEHGFILREATGEDGLRADPYRRETLVEYDADNRWLIENDGFGASQIIARDVAPNVGRWLARRLAATPEAHRE